MHAGFEREFTPVRTIELHDGVVRMIDQRKLPHELVIAEMTDYRTVGRAIQEMWIRGAPALGGAGAFGIALAAQESQATRREEFLRDVERAGQELMLCADGGKSRLGNQPRFEPLASGECAGVGFARLALTEAQAIAEEDVALNTRMVQDGASLIDDGDTIIHHCNTGPLATVDVGTALGCIIEAHRQGEKDQRAGG